MDNLTVERPIEPCCLFVGQSGGSKIVQLVRKMLPTCRPQVKLDLIAVGSDLPLHEA